MRRMWLARGMRLIPNRVFALERPCPAASWRWWARNEGLWAKDTENAGHRQKFRVWVGHDWWKGAQPCRDAKNLIFLMPSWTSFWLGPIPRRPLIRTAFLTA